MDVPRRCQPDGLEGRSPWGTSTVTLRKTQGKVGWRGDAESSRKRIGRGSAKRKTRAFKLAPSKVSSDQKSAGGLAVSGSGSLHRSPSVEVRARRPRGKLEAASRCSTTTPETSAVAPRSIEAVSFLASYCQWLGARRSRSSVYRRRPRCNTKSPSEVVA